MAPCRFLCALALAASSAAVPNLLFIAVDDLRPQLGVYGQPTISPRIDGLARRGVAFARAYAQVSVCSPSRTSFLTGARPDTTRLYTIGPYFRSTMQPPSAAAALVTLPQALKARGYNTTSTGKIWHPGTSSGGDAAWGGGAVGGDDMPFSFSRPPGAAAATDARLLAWECDAWGNSTGQSAASAGVPGGRGCVTSPACVACLVAHNGTSGNSWVATPCGDECYVDALVADHAAAELREHAAAQLPFAMFVGFKRPHLGFQVPQHALDAYPVDVPIAAHRAPPPGMPSVGWYENGEIIHPDTRAFVDHSNATFPGMLADVKHAELRRAYYACVSWLDSQVGRVLDALDVTGLADSTWVTFVGDHGWSLGEHGNWAKQALFEHAVRVPLIVAPPAGAPGFRRGELVGADEAFVEALDLFPTLADAGAFDLAGSVPAGQLAGRSLLPLLRARAPRPDGAAARSQIVRADRNCTPPNATQRAAHPDDSDPPALLPERAPGAAAPPPCLSGVSLRVMGFRYTEWLSYSYDGVAPGPNFTDVHGVELYDHRNDDAAAPAVYDFDADELVNVADDAAFAGVRAQLAQRLREEWGR
jgi:iduronate 2-sulfatase